MILFPTLCLKMYSSNVHAQSYAARSSLIHETWSRYLILYFVLYSIVSCLNVSFRQLITSVGEDIRITCPCNEHPLTPHFYIEKVGFTRVYIFFLFLLKNIDCGYSLEPPQRGGSNVYPQSMF